MMGLSFRGKWSPNDAIFLSGNYLILADSIETAAFVDLCLDIRLLRVFAFNSGTSPFKTKFLQIVF